LPAESAPAACSILPPGHRKLAEEEWGKYIPGTLFAQPRFIPGKKRKSLPLMEYRQGIPFEAGWIDEDGVHRYPAPKTTTII
jgi:hypothetical protein